MSAIPPAFLLLSQLALSSRSPGRGLWGPSEPGGGVGSRGRGRPSLRNFSVLTGSQEAPTITFSTFQPLDLNRRSCQGLGLLPGPRLQALKAEEARPSPRASAAHAAVSGNLGGVAPSSAPTLPRVRACRRTEAKAGMSWVCRQSQGPRGRVCISVRGLHLPSASSSQAFSLTQS